jgi:hypothetical protein
VPITFAGLKKGGTYSRGALATKWGYRSFHAIARGVVTPRNDNKIVLFVTQRKQTSAEQYSDRLIGDILEWEGPNDHFAEDRMVAAKSSGEEIHLFLRDWHHSEFVYSGRIEVVKHVRNRDKPSLFEFRLL